MICPNCKHQKTKDDFYYKKGTNIKTHPDCKSCISIERFKRLTEIQSTGIYFNLKEFAKLMRV